MKRLLIFFSLLLSILNLRAMETSSEEISEIKQSEEKKIQQLKKPPHLRKEFRTISNPRPLVKPDRSIEGLSDRSYIEKFRNQYSKEFDEAFGPNGHKIVKLVAAETDDLLLEHQKDLNKLLNNFERYIEQHTKADLEKIKAENKILKTQLWVALGGLGFVSITSIANILLNTLL